MIKNFLKTAFRNIARNKLFSFLNIFGLALGMSASILIFFWVKDEISYDRHFENHENIVRLVNRFHMNGVNYDQATAAAPVGATMVRDYPEVLNSCRIRLRGSQQVEVGDSKIEEYNMGYVDSTFFDVFHLKVLQGEGRHGFKDPYRIALSEKGAKKYFGEKNAIGESLKIGNKNYMVTSIFENIPENTHFNFDVLVSLNTLQESLANHWLGGNFFTYLVLTPGVDQKTFTVKIQEIVEKYLAPDMIKFAGISLDDPEMDAGAIYELQKLTDIHLHSDLDPELDNNGDILYVYIFGFIAIFILSIACINFMNMSTAKSEGRSKEVGIRKVLGASRSNIIKQYLSESLIMTLIAYLLAMILVELALPSFNVLASKNISIDYYNINNLLVLIAIIAITSLLAGSYPSFYLSSFQPAIVLKGGSQKGKGGKKLRNTLVVIQFMTTIILLSSSTIIFNQLHYINSKALGYDKENLLMVKNAYLLKDKREEFKNELKQHPNINNATISSFLPVPSSSNSAAVIPDGDKSKVVSIYQWEVDYDFINTLRIELSEGREFSKKNALDKNACIINKACAKYFEWTDDPMNHTISCYIDEQGNTEKFQVIGVVNDFHYTSLKDNIQPLFIRIYERGEIITLRYSGISHEEVKQFAESKWKEFLPNQPFQYEYLSNSFENVYRAENRVGKIMNLFTLLAVIIASLGLFGLAAFTAERRTKEIGIRKVNGARFIDIFMLFAKDFTILILIAFIIAVPPTWWYMANWLNNFAYHQEINIFTFILAGLAAYIFALLTISYQAIQASSRNPIESLKYE
jgi:putative ABC transport system permease protein